MITSEPTIKVALVQDSHGTAVSLYGAYPPFSGHGKKKQLSAAGGEDATVILRDRSGRTLARAKEISLFPADPANDFFSITNMRIGIRFHWERLQTLSFCGGIVLAAGPDSTVSIFNLTGLEDYLASVISSEMSAEAPAEFLKVQAVTARSWLAAMLEKKKMPRAAQLRGEDEISVWQDVNDHEGFDVCADDHCQRYQGITRIISGNVARAIKETRGVFLTSGNHICDARYSKCCGGRTEIFATAWEDASSPCLASITDGPGEHPLVITQTDAEAWLSAKPAAYCNTTDEALLRTILPSFDLETENFFRWRVVYTSEELEGILKEKSGIDFGKLRRLEVLTRGPSGRVSRLRIEGSLRTVTVGKELEIRRWLSPTHLLSSAFVITAGLNEDGTISRFIFDGGGWGHGVGLCQIGAASMAARGFKAEEILAHYFPGAVLQKLY